MIEPMPMRKLLLTLVLPALFLGQTPKGRDPLPNEQWVGLFNGKDLTGWTNVGHEKWTVENGVIHGKGESKEYGYLMTEKDYKDCWLSLRYKCEGPGNSASDARARAGNDDKLLRHVGWLPDSVAAGLGGGSGVAPRV